MPAQDRCYVGIDLGTSGCRGISIDPQGKVLASAACPLPASHSPQPGWAEQDPEAWWQATTRVIRRLLEHTPEHEAASIAIDGTSATLLLVDDSGKPLTPGIMYNDQRASSECRRLSTIASPDSAVHSPSSSLSKLLWLIGHHPAPHALAQHQSEWISARLCERFGLGDENNCLKLGYDPVDQCWPDWMEQPNLPPDVLPEVVPPGTIMGAISPTRSAETGLPQSCKVAAGTTDSTAAALAAGLSLPGDALTSLGSTLVCKLLAERPLFSHEYGIYSHRIFGKWLVGGASNVGGNVLRQFFTDRELETLSRRIDPHRSLCLEYYPLTEKGERFPYNDPEMQPRLTPIPKDRQRFLQALLESIAKVEKTAYSRLQELGAAYPSRLFTSGGGAQNTTWMKMRQRILGIPVSPAVHTQAAYGAAMIALKGGSGNS